MVCHAGTCGLTGVVWRVEQSQIRPRFLQRAVFGGVENPYGFVLLVDRRGNVRIGRGSGQGGTSLPLVISLIPLELLDPCTTVGRCEVVVEPRPGTVGEIHGVNDCYVQAVPIVGRIGIR